MKHIYWMLCLAVLFAGAAFLLWGQAPSGLASARYKNAKLPVESRVEDLLGRMTAEEKAAMLAGSGWMETQPNTRLGIPEIKMADGPMGVRNWRASSALTNAPGSTISPVHATSFPASVGMAASWDVDLVKREGQAIGQEVKALGRDMILAPTVNINRVPMWGRNFEGYGEDPYLTSRMGVAYVSGAQGEGVITSVKHFAANNQEFERHRIDEKIDERALHEIYFPAFKAAVQEAGSWAVMSAYNKVNGQWASENPYLLTDTLKKRWGFNGFVISDWGSTYSTDNAIMAGLDLEMPGGEPMQRWMVSPSTIANGNGSGFLTADKVLGAVRSDRVKQEVVDDSVRRLLRIMFAAGLFDKPKPGDGPVDTPEQRALARTAARESIVLLKNAGGVLPLTPSKVRSVALIGPNAVVARPGGGGSSLVNPNYSISPLQGIRDAAGSQVQVTVAPGVSMEGEGPTKETPETRRRMLDEAVTLAGKSDVAVVVVGKAPSLEGEGDDIRSMDLPAGQDELIQAVAAVNRHTAVVLVAGSPVTMTKWIDLVPAVMVAWYGGQEGGHAIGDVLFGAVNPSGKLPVTFPREFKDATAYGNYPGVNMHVEYAEGIYVGYRGFDKKGVMPMFPFGHGLSYTSFTYSDLKVTPAKAGQDNRVQVTARVRNSGDCTGAEVVQLYLTDIEASVDRPPKELKGFSRVTLQPGQSQTLTFTIDKNAMSFYSTAKKDWVAEPGRFEVLIGASSRDIRLKGSFELVH